MNSYFSLNKVTIDEVCFTPKKSFCDSDVDTNDTAS